MNIAVFVSGRGSNLKAIINSPKLKNIINIKAVYSDKTDCKAFDTARQNFISTFCLGNKSGFISDDNLTQHLVEQKIELIVLAGFLKMIPSELIKKFAGKIINIHPALLPSFGGKGMYGINVHKAVYNSSAKVSGVSVHFVDESYDTGKIIAQKCVDISEVKSPEEIAEKVLKIEHEILPEVIYNFSQNKIKVIDGRVFIESDV